MAHVTRTILLSMLALVATPASARAQMLGEDAAACAGGQGPAIEARITGLKDRKGEVKLELYPANEEDFLKDDRDLIAQNKVFRRVTATTPASGAVTLCIRVPRPGRYALLFTHNRDNKNKFSFWTDGAGFPSNRKLGRSRPKVDEAIINAGAGVTTTAITAQYLRGLGGFSPIGR